jgi:hypothetical protein
MKAALGFLFVVAMPCICTFLVQIATFIVDTLCDCNSRSKKTFIKALARRRLQTA